MRQVEIERKTKETKIKLGLNLDGQGIAEVETPVPFLDHMLNLFARHGLFDLKLEATGDVEIDAHHIVEDIGIVLGQALKRALGDKKRINRYGSQTIPMDEALIQAVVDCSGRFYLNYNVGGLKDKVGEFDTELGLEFFRSLAYNGGLNLHIRKIEGENTHHILEGIFKSFARALKEAVVINENIKGVMSTKGKLE